MNIIILGCGKVGRKLTERLCAEKDHNITVVDVRYNVVQSLTNTYDIMGICGSGTNVDTLVEAGIEDADIFIAVTGNDEINLIACLTAKKLGGCKTIARVKKSEYSKSLGLIKEELGLELLINPDRIAAREIARILRFPTAIQIDTFAKGRVEILKFKIPSASPLDGIKVMDIVGKLKCDVLVCGVEREGNAFIPDGNSTLQSGDLISIVASLKSANSFFKKININTNSVKDAVIVGGGNIAFFLASILIENGINVKIIEKDVNRCNELCQLLPKARVIIGDGTDSSLLAEEGITKAESFISLTTIDEENILLSLFAKTKSKAKVVTKINRLRYDTVIDDMDLGTVVYPKDIAAEYIVRFVRAKNNSIGSNIETMHFILEGKAEALEFRISEDSPLANIALEDMKLKKNLIVACINRKGHVIIPRGKDVFLPGDTVIIVTQNSGFDDIADIIK